jgi:hypothetical protein
MDAQEVSFAADLQISRLDVAKAEHVAKESVAQRTVVRIQARDARPQKDAVGQLRLDFQQFGLKETALSGASEALTVEFQSEAQISPIKLAIRRGTAQFEFRFKNRLDPSPAIVNWDWNLKRKPA